MTRGSNKSSTKGGHSPFYINSYFFKLAQKLMKTLRLLLLENLLPRPFRNSPIWSHWMAWPFTCWPAFTLSLALVSKNKTSYVIKYCCKETIQIRGKLIKTSICPPNGFTQRTLTVGGSITVRLVSSLTRMSFTKKENMWLLLSGEAVESKLVKLVTGCSYSETSLIGECSLHDLMS